MSNAVAAMLFMNIFSLIALFAFSVYVCYHPVEKNREVLGIAFMVTLFGIMSSVTIVVKL